IFVAFPEDCVLTGSNSSAPIPLRPTKQSISMGFKLLAARPLRASQALISVFPYLSGRTSASKPGKPLKVVVSFNSGNENIGDEELKGIMMGEISSFPEAKAGSNSKTAYRLSSSQETAPASSSHICTKAV